MVEVEEVVGEEVVDIIIREEDGMVEILVTDIEDHNFVKIILDMFHGGHRRIGL